MATLPADEDYARALLAIFSSRDVRARQSLKLSDVQASFLVQNMGRPADFEAALQYAAAEGWLARSLDMVRLTQPGAEEMETVTWPIRGARRGSPGAFGARQRSRLSG